MDANPTPIVMTKVRAPAVRPRTVQRARLLELLSEESAGLLLVCAPAGYGKTTLLAEWARGLSAAGTAVAWLALDPEDDDAAIFGLYLVASLVQALGPLPELLRTGQLLRSSPEMELQRILPGLINAIAADGRRCVLILDDYHVIGSPAVHSALVYLLEHRPDNLRLAAGSRTDPPLPLARLRARGQLREARAAQLRFTPEEASMFLNQVMRLDLPEAGVRLLEERTEGWIAGLQLAGLSLAGQADKSAALAAFSGEQRYLVDYWLEEVVNRQPEEIRAFLLSTCVLERMRGDLCDTLTETSNGQETLRALEQSNLFVLALDDRGEWFRYHHLFRDFLLNRLNYADSGRIPALRRAACQALIEKGLLREAARQAFASGEWDFAADFVEEHNFTLIVHSDIATMREWCAAFPEAVMQRRPMLCILQALALAYGYRRQNQARVEARLAQAETMIDGLADREATEGMHQLAAVVRTFQAFTPDPAADPEKLLALARLMTGAYSPDDAGQFSGLLVAGYAHLAQQNICAAEQTFETARQIAQTAQLFFGMVESTFHLAQLALAQGRLTQAAQICRQARDEISAALGDAEQTLPALGSLDTLVGAVRLEQGQFEEAEILLRSGLDRMGGSMNPYYLMAAYTALARLHEIQGRAADARDCLDRLETTWPDLSFYTQGLLVCGALRARPRDASSRAHAAAWSRQFAAALPVDCLPGLGPFGAAEAYFTAGLARAEIEIQLGQPATALDWLDRQVEQAGANGLDGRVIELSILQALGWWQAGNHSRAMDALGQALALATPEGYRAVFDRGPALSQLLAEAARRGITAGEIRAIQPATVPDPSPAPGMAPLSERELEVLRLIAEGASNQEVAGQLVITVGTVKSHMNHILTKLDARNRTEAVARARALGWLDP